MSKNISSRYDTRALIALGITALIFSRSFFFFQHDPEGPNLVVVLGVALMVYIVSLTAYMVATSSLRKLWSAICIQLLLVGVLCLYVH